MREIAESLDRLAVHCATQISVGTEVVLGSTVMTDLSHHAVAGRIFYVDA